MSARIKTPTLDPNAPTPPAEISSLPGQMENFATDPESKSALDDAFKAVGGNPSSPEEPLEDLSKDEAPVTEKSTDELPPVIEEPKKKEKKSIKEVVISDDPEPVKEENPLPQKDEFDAFEIPGAKPKASEAFNKVKDLARERVAALSKERDELNEKVKELSAKADAGLPKEIQEELNSLRSFRASMDVEADPAFSTYDKTIAENLDAIYTKLASAGVPADQIAKIKELGGPAEVDWGAPGVTLSTTLRRYLDSKLVENETLAEKKQAALKSAKASALQYVATKQEESTKNAEARNKAVSDEITALLPKFTWFRELKPKDGATEDEKASIEAHNELISNAKKTFEDAASDDSPAMRAILALGHAQLMKTKADFAALKASSAAKEAKLTAELTEANKLIEKIKKNSTSRLRDIPSEDGETSKPKTVDLNTHSGDALDRHLAAIEAKAE